MKKIILIGFFDECIELCEKCGYEIVGYVDMQPQKCEYLYLGDDDCFLAQKQMYIHIPLFLVPDNPEVRERVYARYHGEGFIFETIVSPDAIVSPSAKIGEGCMVQDGCNISANVKLGICVRVNSMANVMHDTYVGDFSIVAPSAVLLGKVTLGEKTYVGANATILPHLKIQGGCIGAGAVVTKDIPCPITVVGNPARELK